MFRLSTLLVSLLTISTVHAQDHWWSPDSLSGSSPNHKLRDLSIPELREQLIKDSMVLLQTLKENTSTGDLKETFEKMKREVEMLLKKEEAAFFNINMELKIPGINNNG